MDSLYSKYCECGYRVTTDSRRIEGGEIFFALKGENFDGNAYALSALEKGAAWAVADSRELPENPRLIIVEDAFKSLQELAIRHRNTVCEGKLPVIGLTGTNGKTTTKNLIETVLSKKYKVCATKGNLNNDIGVPLSLLSIRPDTEIAVIEMGANHPDDIAKLVKISRPDYGLITNVGKGHLLGFGSFEGVKAAKGELYKWLGAHRGSLIFINEDDENLREMAQGLPCHFFGYGRKLQGVKILPTSPEEPYLRLSIKDDVINTLLIGSYNTDNVLAALAVGEYFGVGFKDACAAIREFEPNNKRSQMLRSERNSLIVDAYNANPSSMNAALDNFIAMHSEKKLALLGDMRELGKDSFEEHVAVVKKIYQAGLEARFVGEEFRKAVVSLGSDYPCYESSMALKEALALEPVSDTLILLKGSRSIEMEKCMEVL